MVVDNIKFCLDVVGSPNENWPKAKEKVLTTNELILLSLIFGVVATIIQFIVWSRSGVLVLVFGPLINLGTTFAAAEMFLFLSQYFGGNTDRNSCQKLAVISFLPCVIAQFFIVIPYLGYVIYLIGVAWAIYCEYIGIPAMTGVPAERRLVYFVTTICCSIGIAIVFSSIYAFLYWIF